MLPTHDVYDSGYEVAMCGHDHLPRSSYADEEEDEEDDGGEHASVISSCRSHSFGATSSSSSSGGDDHRGNLTKCAENAKLLDPNEYTDSPTLNYIEVETDALSETGYGSDMYSQA